MRKALTVLAAALLASCASQQKTAAPSAPSATAAERNRDATAVVDPSKLNGEQVRLLQRALVDRGFAIDMTGNFDPATQSALAQFQRARGLPATGNLNGPTMDALGLDPRDVRQPVGTAGTEVQQSAPTGTGSRSTDAAPSDTAGTGAAPGSDQGSTPGAVTPDTRPPPPSDTTMPGTRVR